MISTVSRSCCTGEFGAKPVSTDRLNVRVSLPLTQNGRASVTSIRLGNTGTTRSSASVKLPAVADTRKATGGRPVGTVTRHVADALPFGPAENGTGIVEIPTDALMG